MSWNNLKAGIAAIIRANGNQEITGTNLQSVLNAMVNGLGQNATFAGVAVPSTNPGVPDGPVFYLAGRHGRYSNFGNVRFDTSNAIAIFVWDGSTWSKTELEFTVEGGGGGGGGGTDIDPNIATFTSSKVTIKVPLDVWDEATFTKIFVGDDNMDVEDTLVHLLTKTHDISVSTSATTGEDIVDIETEVLIEGDLEVLDDVLIHKTVTINDGDGEVFIESGVVSADGIDANAISVGTILLNRVDLGTTLTALNTKTAGISRTVSSNVGTTTIGEDLVISGGLTVSGAMINGNVSCDDIFCDNVEADAYFTSGGLNIVTAAVGSIANTTATANAVTIQYNDLLNDSKGTATINNADATHAGVMTAAMFNKLDGIENGAEKNIIKSVKVDGTALSPDANGAVNIQVKPLLGGAFPTTTPPVGQDGLLSPADNSNYYLGQVNSLGFSWYMSAMAAGTTIAFEAAANFDIVVPYDDGSNTPTTAGMCAQQAILSCESGKQYCLSIIAINAAGGAKVNVFNLVEIITPA